MKCNDYNVLDTLSMHRTVYIVYIYKDTYIKKPSATATPFDDRRLLSPLLISSWSRGPAENLL